MINTKNYNAQYFSKEDIEKGLHLNFIKLLIEQGVNGAEYFNDVHIRPLDLDAIQVEWSQVDLSSPEDWGAFEFVDTDQVIMTDYTLPDNSSILVGSEAEAKEAKEEWFKQHPTWIRSEITGRYYDPEENKIINSEDDDI